MSNRVVVTGMGCISGLGKNIEEFWTGLCRGENYFDNIVGSFHDVKISKGAQVPDYVPEDYFNKEELLLLDRFSQFSLIAAREAISNSGLMDEHEILRKAAVIIGTGCGGKQTDEDTYFNLYVNNKSRVHPLTIPKGMPSAAASTVSRCLGIKGPVFSVTSACASGAHAIIQGTIMIRSGIVDTVLVGGSDAPFTYGLLKAWEALRVVSNDTCRPFSRDRSGIVLGEGAGMLVLESQRQVSARGLNKNIEVVGCGMSSDAGHITRPDVNGIVAAIQAALADGGLAAKQVDYINAHGTGTVANDEVETKAINQVFGEYARNLAISSTKSMHGHALGASSAMEFISTVLTLENGIMPPTMNYLGKDQACDLDYIANNARKKQVTTALSNSFAFGGLNAVLAAKLIE